MAAAGLRAPLRSLRLMTAPRPGPNWPHNRPPEARAWCGVGCGGWPVGVVGRVFTPLSDFGEVSLCGVSEAGAGRQHRRGPPADCLLVIHVQDLQAKFRPSYDQAREEA